jgi:hypothetical protein
MNRDGHDGVAFFWGNEVEHTPMLGRPTLFVVGLRSVSDIERELEKRPDVEHIFFGANDSYLPSDWKDHQAWESMIATFLDRGHWCSLDIPFRYVEEFHEGGLCEHHRFIPIIKVPIPYSDLWNYNTCVKIDDRDFAATNPGVWVHQLHALMSRDRFTDWSQYSKDAPVND